ncbi:NB-ARC domains-containing protein [Tanacetum coccineum]
MSDNTKKAQCKHCFHFFLKDSNSTLKHHISHPHCEALKRVAESGQSSMSRDGSIFVYNPDVLREQFAGLVIQRGLPFNHFDDEQTTRVFQNHLQPKYNHVSRTTLKRDAMKLWVTAKQAIIDGFLNLNTNVNLTTDVWTAPHGLPGSYICVTAHWIEPGTWQMMKRVIAFEDFPVPYTGSALAKTLRDVFVNFKLENKIMSITLDNASNNTSVIGKLRLKYEPPVEGRFYHSRCVAHIINLCVQDGLAVLTISKIKESFKTMLKDVFKSGGNNHQRYIKICKQAGNLVYHLIGTFRQDETSLIICSKVAFDLLRDALSAVFGLSELKSPYSAAMSPNLGGVTFYRYVDKSDLEFFDARYVMHVEGNKMVHRSLWKVDCSFQFLYTLLSNNWSCNLTFDVLGFWKAKETMFPVLSRMAMDILSVQATSIASESTFSTSGRVLSIRRTRLTLASLEMCMCLKDHLEAQERKQDKSTLETPVDFEEEILDAEVQENEAIPLSDEEIALDAASSEGSMSAPSSGGEEADYGYDQLSLWEDSEDSTFYFSLHFCTEEVKPSSAQDSNVAFNPSLNAPQKDLKRSTLLELLDFVSNDPPPRVEIRKIVYRPELSLQAKNQPCQPSQSGRPLATKITLKVSDLCYDHVAERALLLWNNDQIFNLIGHNRQVILPIIFPALETNVQTHWNQSVLNLTLNVRNVLTEMDNMLFLACQARFLEEQEKQNFATEKRKEAWDRLENAASLQPISGNTTAVLSVIQLHVLSLECVPFSRGDSRGSKVIITTRKDQLLKELGCGQLNPLQCLSHDDAVSLFCQHALDANNFDLHSTLKAHGEDIVRKCKGLPLALIALGRLLRRKDDEGWKEMVDSEIWSLKEDEEEGGGIIPALKTKATCELPASLKQLFAYCSLFPKDDLFKKDDLVLLWMAEGFLHQSDPRKLTEERLGHYYFEELLSRSFFQHAPDDESLFVKHDLMHDLATSVAGDFFFRLEKEMGKDVRKLALEKLRHMSFVREKYEAYKKFMVFKEANCLRTFLLVGLKDWRKSNYLPNKVLADLLPQLPLLRVINLSYCMISEVPECIGSLKQLRYINFSGTYIRNLPETVCDLYNLQTLIVSGCCVLSKLPKNFSKLKNLRHLDIRDTPDLKDMPLGIGELKSLQTLSKIIIGGENDFSITQLKDLKNLRGSVSIKGLNKVKEANRAREDAKEHLITKESLNDALERLLEQKYGKLSHVWMSNKPGLWPPNLRKLYIGSLKKPISEWGPQKFPTTLVDLVLLGDKKKEAATNWSQLSHLHLPSSLVQLGILEFENLETVSKGLQHLTSLQYLEFSNCPTMKDLQETLFSLLLLSTRDN